MNLKYPQSASRTTTGPLTDLEFLRRYAWLEEFVSLNEGIRPSMREISQGWGVSVTAAGLCLDTMEKRGWVEYARDAGGNRLDRGLILRGTTG